MRLPAVFHACGCLYSRSTIELYETNRYLKRLVKKPKRSKRRERREFIEEVLSTWIGMLPK